MATNFILAGTNNELLIANYEIINFGNEAEGDKAIISRFRLTKFHICYIQFFSFLLFFSQNLFFYLVLIFPLGSWFSHLTYTDFLEIIYSIIYCEKKKK